ELRPARRGARPERARRLRDRRGRARAGRDDRRTGCRRRGSRDGRPARRRRGATGRRRPALARLRELRPVRELRAPRRGVHATRAEPRRVKRGQLESNLLVLVTLALVAFGLVMVYSATSASAAVGGRDPSYYLKRQALFAVLGIGAMIFCARGRYRGLRLLAPTLIVGSLVLLAGVVVAGERVNGARRWITLGPVNFQPSEVAKVAVVVWAGAYLARREPPRTLAQLGKPLGLQLGLFCLLLLAEPDLGTAITIALILGAMLLVAGTPTGLLVRGGGIVAAVGLLAIWVEPYRRARVFSFVNPWHDAQGAGFQIVQAMIGLGSGGIFGVGLGQGV